MEYTFNGTYVRMDMMKRLKVGDVLVCGKLPACDLVCRNLYGYGFRYSREMCHDGVRKEWYVKITVVPDRITRSNRGTLFSQDLVARMHKALESV